MIFRLLTLIGLVFNSLGVAYALPEGALINPLASQMGHEEVTNTQRFEGIVKLSNCSGALVKFQGARDEQKAVVMTNGHCVQKPGGYLNPGEVWVNKVIKRSMGVFDAQKNLHKIEATKILYATMTKTDVAYYEMNLTYKQIKDRFNVDALEMSPQRPIESIKIEIVSGYWEKNYQCEIDGFVFKLLEGAWTFEDSIRYNQVCNTIGGTSGSPIIEKDTKRVIGINNTSNESGKSCELNNPCEVDEAGVRRVIKGRSYGQQTYNVYSCLDTDLKFDLTLINCDLAKP